MREHRQPCLWAGPNPLPLQTILFKFLARFFYITDEVHQIIDMDQIVDRIEKLPLPVVTKQYLCRFLKLTRHTHTLFYRLPSDYQLAEPL